MDSRPWDTVVVKQDIQRGNQFPGAKMLQPGDKTPAVGHTQTANHNPCSACIQALTDILAVTHPSTGLHRLRGLREKLKQG